MSGVIDLVNGVLELLMIVFFFTFLLTPRWKTGYTVLLWALIDGIPPSPRFMSGSSSATCAALRCFF